ncbi:MAG TPA: DUF456 domain-containing protein [Longimicrobiaceae bacterium]|jgi:uncharacterized protein YqgC (DUF456 family)|nr:DUF456 domain-containing protein [Longimicrobiaceae bacterium]
MSMGSEAYYVLLVVVEIAGLLMIPFGFPGLWVQLAGLACYAMLTDFRTVGLPSIAFVAVLAVVAEALEWVLGDRFARKYGGGKRASWGALLGGIAGAMLGLPIPVVGSVVGAFLGSFLGAAAFELHGRRELAPALRVGWGALLGRLAATAVKAGMGAVALTVVLFGALG